MYPKVKRALDLLAAAGLLLLCSPVIGAVALAIAAQGDGPVLFRQERPGLRGELFECLKFRTMRAPISPEEGDMGRITRLGGFLRRFSLDELPQFWNVLRGDMSFVGPRPLLPEYLAFYSPEQARRHGVRPGITGWAQVNGRNALDWDRRLALDVEYVERCSFALDVKIFLRTIRNVLTGEGVNRNEALTAEKFSDYARRRDEENIK